MGTMLTQGEPRSFGRLARARDGAVRAVDGWPLWLLALIGLTICFVFYGGFPMSAHRVLGLISQSPLDPPTLLNGRPITSGDAYQYSSPLGPLMPLFASFTCVRKCMRVPFHQVKKGLPSLT